MKTNTITYSKTFTGTQLKRAKERIEQLHSAIKKGQQILIGE